jgi:hypothetical protein
LGINLEKAQWVEKTKLEINVFNQTNDRGEILGFQDDPEQLLQNNTVTSILLGTQLIPNLKLETEIGESAYNNESQGFKDWALLVDSTFFLDKMLNLSFRFPVSISYRKVNPDFINQQNSIIDSAVYTPERIYQSSVGDSSLVYNNEEAWQVDAKVGGTQTLFRIIYGGRHQIHETDNTVASTHYLDAIHYNGAVWWHVFFNNYGQETNAAAEDYADHVQGSRKIETLYWRGNTETITLRNITQGRKYLSFINFDFRQNLQEWMNLSTPFYFQLYSDFQNLHEQIEGTPFGQSASLLFQAYSQAVLAYPLGRSVFVIAEYGQENWISERVNPAVNYLDKSVGIGFDCMLDERTYVFFRWKHYQHSDLVISDNNFGAEQLYLELKKYF